MKRPLSSLPKLPATRFNRETSGGEHMMAYPWSMHDSPAFIKKLHKGWRAVGQAKNASLSDEARRGESGGPYIAVMFQDPDGFDVFFHMGDYPYVFIES